MHCSACQHENREEAKFCEACGQKLALTCSACGNPARAGAAFCDTCGTALKTKSKVKKQRSKGKNQSLTPNPQSPLGERRQLTVMFCDLVGSTALSARLDPEELRAVVRDYQHVCGEVIRRFDGHVAQYLGDGEKREQLALGETPNLAARLQGVAEPDTVVVSAVTYRLIEGLFDSEDLGAVELKGIALYDPQQHRALAVLYGGADPGMYCLSGVAFALWNLGYPTQALKRSQEAIDLAQELSHPHSLAFALSLAARVHQLCRREQAAQDLAEVVIALSTEQRLAFWLAWGTTVRGGALVEQGRGEEGIARIHQALTRKICRRRRRC